MIDPGNAAPPAGRKQESGTKDSKPKRDWMTVFTGLLLGVGFATCGIMTWQNVLTSQAIDKSNEANEIAKSTLAASQRAWIGPQDVKILEDPVGSQTVRIEVYYKNVGREPATSVWNKIDFLGIKNFGKLPLAKDDCKAALPDMGSQIAYPSESLTYRSFINVVNLNETKDTPKVAFSNAVMINVHGCFTYETFGERHFSRFCFKISPVKDKPYGEWPWVFCPSGNEAN